MHTQGGAGAHGGGGGQQQVHRRGGREQVHAQGEGAGAPMGRGAGTLTGGGDPGAHSGTRGGRCPCPEEVGLVAWACVLAVRPELAVRQEAEDTRVSRR